MSQPISLTDAILTILFYDGENFKKMTVQEIYENLVELNWIHNIKKTDIEIELKNNEKMFGVNNELYTLSDYGICCAYKVDFY